jgi:toxin CcdB
MAKFDVYAFRSRYTPFVVDVQSSLLSSLATRVVAPLGRFSELPDRELQRLKPVVSLDGEAYLFLAPDITAVLAKDLRNPIANLESRYRDDITRALDFLFQGF